MGANKWNECFSSFRPVSTRLLINGFHSNLKRKLCGAAQTFLCIKLINIHKDISVPTDAQDSTQVSSIISFL